MIMYVDYDVYYQGESILKTLMAAGQVRKLKIKIAQNKPTKGDYYNNTRDLAKYGKMYSLVSKGW